jgi:uncharacterized protein YeaO (DUF488 family)
MDVRIKRIYDEAAPEDGTRVLVDRLWPRGVRKEEAGIDLWLKAVAPSPDLRKSWHDDPQGHEASHFAAFADSYRDELSHGEASDALDELIRLAKEEKRLTLLYGAKDTKVNHAVVLREALLERAG